MCSFFFSCVSGSNEEEVSCENTGHVWLIMTPRGTTVQQEKQRRVEKQTVQAASKYDFCQVARKGRSGRYRSGAEMQPALKSGMKH